MFVLHVELNAKPGSEKALENTFVGTFIRFLSEKCN